jgi:hypothetical protein
MLDDWTSRPQTTSKPAPSLLDDWAVPTTKPKSEEVQAKVSAPSMLDQLSSPTPPAPKFVAKPAQSMLDEWNAPVAKPKIDAPKAAPPSLLDEWTAPAQPYAKSAIEISDEKETLAPSQSESTIESSSFLANPTMPTSMPNSADDGARADGVTVFVQNDRNTQGEPKTEPGIASQVPDLASRKTDVEEAKVEEPYKMPKGLKQPPPEAFKEPDPNSLLDAFGF